MKSPRPTVVFQTLFLIIANLAPVGCGSLAAYSVRRPLDCHIVFQPSPFPQGNWNPKGLHFEDAHFTAADGTSLHGWFVESKDPKAVVLYAHGNAGNITSRHSVLRMFQERLNCSILIFDYRGYGKSKGEPTEEGVLADTRSARAWLAKRTNTKERDIVLVGASLGGGVMVDLAANDGARGLVLENTFTSLPDVASKHFWYLPTHSIMSTRLNSLAEISNYKGPLLQTHGDADDIVPYELGKKLFDAANEPKQFVKIPGGNHNDHPTPTYIAALETWLTNLPK